MDTTFFSYNSSDSTINSHHALTYGETGAYMHNHNFYEIFLLLSDRASFAVEGSRYEMSKGDIIIFNNKELHKVDYDYDKPYERFVIHFTKELLLPFCDDKFNLQDAFENRSLGMYNLIPQKIAQQENIIEYFDKISICTLNKTQGSEIMFKCYLIQMIVAINRVTSESVKNKEKKGNDDKILMILKFINDNLQSDLALNALSEQFFISKFHMAHLFKEVTGYSINQYVTYKRIFLAEEKISEGMAASDACEAVGFNDYSNFYKTFCKITGHSPKYSKKI